MHYTTDIDLTSIKSAQAAVTAITTGVYRYSVGMMITAWMNDLLEKGEAATPTQAAKHIANLIEWDYNRVYYYYEINSQRKTA